MSKNEALSILIRDLELMLETRTLTMEKLESFWEDVSDLAKKEENVDLELLYTIKSFVLSMTSKLEFEADKLEVKIVPRERRNTREQAMRSIDSNPNEAQVKKVGSMLMLVGGFFAGAVVSTQFMRKPFNPVAKTMITVIATKIAEKGFENAYEEFQNIKF